MAKISGTLVASLATVVAAGMACGGSPPVVTPPALVLSATPPPPPPPARARWVFSHKDTGLLAKLDLGDGSTLYVGHNGRRELGRGDGPLVDAPILAPADLVGVLRDEKGQIALVGDDGSVFVAHEPLGALDAPRPGPLGAEAKPGTTLRSVATGKMAIVAVAQDGRLFRSTDQGASWRTLDVAVGHKPSGRPVSVALDTKGNGLLLQFPQRLYVTHDDGASWSPIATPGIGARAVRRDGADNLLFEGRAGSGGARIARLEGSGLSLTTDGEVPVYALPRAASKSDKDAKREQIDRRSERLILSGDHVVGVAEIFRHGKAREVEVGSAKLGEFPQSGTSTADLIGAYGMSRHIAGHGGDFVYLREDDDVDPGAPTTTVFRSADYGASWQKESTLKGSQLEESNGVDVAVGPRGWTFVTALCPRYSPEGRKCAHRQIRAAGASAYEDMEFDEELTPTAFAFDEPHDRVYVIGIHNSTKYVYESPLGQNRFTRTKLLEVSSYAPTALTVDAQGTVRVMAYDASKGEWVLRRQRAGGEEEPPMYVPLETGTVALAGSRGLIIVSRQRGWETADGGETWARVATNGIPQGLSCDEAGCINGSAQRVGWDLPAVQDMEKVGATKEPKPAGTQAKATAQVATAPLDLVCKPAGATTQLATTPGSEMVDGRSADVRWASVKHEDLGKTSIVFGTRGSVRESLLLAAAAPRPPKPGGGSSSSSSPTSGERVLNDGVVAARFRPVMEEQTGDRSLDIDLAWWSASTGRTIHHTLTKVKPFYTYGFAGTPQIVDGGILYQTQSSEPVYFIHDDGRVETFTLPRDATVRNGERLGKRWILADPGAGDVVLSSSDDQGKTWSQKSWGLEDSGTSLLVLLAGKPTLSFARSYQPSALFPVDAVLPDDPPAPVVVDDSSIDTPCDAHAGTLRVSSYVPTDARHLRARVELAAPPVGSSPSLPAGRLSVATRITHGTPQGTVCTTAYVLNGNDPKTYDSQTAFLYPEAKGWSGWWFRRVVDARDSSKKNLVAEPLTCAPGGPEPGR